MGYDAKREDYQRMAIRYARSLDQGDPVVATRAFSNFGRRLAQERDSLPQTDADRAFHLVADATDLIDYQLPFSTDEQAQEIVARAQALLAEAVSLDSHCYDAERMAFDPTTSFEGRYRRLAEREPEVLAGCSEARDREGATQDERTKLAQEIAMRPWRRWMASMAELALICGRNRTCLRLGERLLADDPTDTAGVHLTMALAYAKLEDAAGLQSLAARCAGWAPARGADDAWMLLAQVAIAQKAMDLSLASKALDRIIRTYPQAVRTILRQTELPDGAFSRVITNPYSEDELIVAVSEATVLLDEGADLSGRGPLGLWMAQETARLRPHLAAQTLSQMAGGALQ